jgi:hypothetical protein
MFKHWAARLFALTLCAAVPKEAFGQGSIKGASPNPFNPTTTITFNVGPGSCSDATKQYVVSFQIRYLVGSVEPAYPILQATGPGTRAVSGVSRPINGLKLPCGQYTAFWNGKEPRTGKEVPSGVYTGYLIVDGKVAAKFNMSVVK